MQYHNVSVETTESREIDKIIIFNLKLNEKKIDSDYNSSLIHIP